MTGTGTAWQINNLFPSKRTACHPEGALKRTPAASIHCPATSPAAEEGVFFRLLRPGALGLWGSGTAPLPHPNRPLMQPCCDTPADAAWRSSFCHRRRVRFWERGDSDEVSPLSSTAPSPWHPEASPRQTAPGPAGGHRGRCWLCSQGKAPRRGSPSHLGHSTSPSCCGTVNQCLTQILRVQAHAGPKGGHVAATPAPVHPLLETCVWS